MAKRLRMSFDSLQDVASGEELSLYATAPNSSESAQVNLYMVALFCLFVCFFTMCPPASVLLLLNFELVAEFSFYKRISLLLLLFDFVMIDHNS